MTLGAQSYQWPQDSHTACVWLAFFSLSDKLSLSDRKEGHQLSYSSCLCDPKTRAGSLLLEFQIKKSWGRKLTVWVILSPPGLIAVAKELENSRSQTGPPVVHLTLPKVVWRTMSGSLTLNHACIAWRPISPKREGNGSEWWYGVHGYSVFVLVFILNGLIILISLMDRLRGKRKKESSRQSKV